MAIYRADIGTLAQARFATFLLGREDEDTAEIALALGGRIVYQGGVADAFDRLDAFTGHLVVACDLSDDDAVDSELLARIDALAAARAWPLIVSSTIAGVDPVAAACCTAQVIQLCDPALDDWTAAFIEADVRQERLHDNNVRESEAARLTRLNAEVARIAEVVARLSNRAQPGDPRRAAETPLRFAAPPVDFAITGPQVRDVIRARRLRDRFFEGGLFEDPAWDMLLDLLAAQLERAQVSVSSLCIAAAVPPTTALRWIAKLTDAGLLEREADPFDKRRAYLKLSPAAAAAMQRYVAAVRDANLPFV
jgi:DNA-binding transcriptional ArsR family regulator